MIFVRDGSAITMASEVVAYQAGPTVELTVLLPSELSPWTLQHAPETRSRLEIECQLYDYRLRSLLDNLAQYKLKRSQSVRRAVVSAVFQRSQMLGRLHGLVSALAQMAREMFPFGRRRIRGQAE